MKPPKTHDFNPETAPNCRTCKDSLTNNRGNYKSVSFTCTLAHTCYALRGKVSKTNICKDIHILVQGCK